MLQPLKSLLGSVLQRRPIAEGVRTAVVLEAAREAIESLFPASVAMDIEPRVFRAGTITIGVKSAVVGQELQLRRTALLRLVGERVGVGTVTRIQVARMLPRQPSDDMVP